MHAGCAAALLPAILLAAGMGAVAAQPTPQPTKISYTATGPTQFTAARMPLPAGTLVIQHVNFQFLGPDVIMRRVELEHALISALPAIAPLNYFGRTASYFTYPSSSPGFEQFTSVIIGVDFYMLQADYDKMRAVAAVPAEQYPFTAQSSYASVVVLEKLVQQKLKSSTAVFTSGRLYLESPAQRAEDDVVLPSSPADRLWANTLSQLQLTGDGLVPFAADKAAAFSHTVYHAFGNNTSVFSLNVSDYTTVRLPTGNRKLLQLASTVVILNVWTDARGANFSPSAYWDGVFSSDCLDAVGRSADRWTGDFLNATTLLRSANGTTVATVFDPPAASRAAAPASGGDSHGLSAGAIAGIVVGAVAAAAVLVYAVAWAAGRHRSSRPSEQQQAQQAAANVSESEASFDSNENVTKADAAEGMPPVRAAFAVPGDAAALLADTAGHDNGAAVSREADVAFTTSASKPDLHACA